MSTFNKRGIARFFVSNTLDTAEQAADTPDHPGETGSFIDFEQHTLKYIDTDGDAQQLTTTEQPMAGM